MSLIAFDQEHRTGQTLSPQQFSTLTGFPNFLLLQGIEKSDFLDTSLGSKNPSKNRSHHRGPPQYAFG